MGAWDSWRFTVRHFLHLYPPISACLHSKNSNIHKSVCHPSPLLYTLLRREFSCRTSSARTLPAPSIVPVFLFNQRPISTVWTSPSPPSNHSLSTCLCPCLSARIPAAVNNGTAEYIVLCGSKPAPLNSTLTCLTSLKPFNTPVLHSVHEASQRVTRTIPSVRATNTAYVPVLRR